MADKQSPLTPVSQPGDPLDLSTSVAGEEDPGASFDAQPGGTTPALAQGDEAPSGTPGTGEDVCPECGGSGRTGVSACSNCDGSGKVIVGIGGA